MSAKMVSDQPLVCLFCNTRNYDDPIVTHCRGCGYKIRAGKGKYCDPSRITVKGVR